MKKIVVIGGGTGIYPVTSALKHLDTSVSTVITVSDNGGSAGRIRDEFGFQPVGDLRQSLAALAENEGQEWIRNLLLYRFDRGDGLKGHNMGNLILTALQDMTGSTDEALQKATQIFRIEGEVIPATTTTVDLKIIYHDGTEIIGEDFLDQPEAPSKKIDRVELVPEASINPRAQAAIQNADYIIIGPGDFYASIMPALVCSGTKEAFANSSAKVLYLLNLMTRSTQTKDMSAHDHVSRIEDTIGKPVTTIIMNDQVISAEILTQYAQHEEFPVDDDLNDDTRVVRAPILSDEAYIKPKSDVAHRSVLRHDSKKLIPVLRSLIQ